MTSPPVKFSVNPSDTYKGMYCVPGRTQYFLGPSGMFARSGNTFYKTPVQPNPQVSTKQNPAVAPRRNSLIRVTYGIDDHVDESEK